MTPQLIAFLTSEENFKPYPYYANKYEQARCILSIGFGTTEINGVRITALTVKAPITLDQAKQYVIDTLILLQKNLSNALLIYPELASNEVDAVLSLLYNMGPRGAPNLLDYLNHNNLTWAALEFMNGIYVEDENGQEIASQGLCYRRASEYDIFTKAVYVQRNNITAEHKALFLQMNNSDQAIEVIDSLIMEV